MSLQSVALIPSGVLGGAADVEMEVKGRNTAKTERINDIFTWFEGGRKSKR